MQSEEPPPQGESSDTEQRKVDNSPYRPAVLFNALIYRGPRLFGWNDDDFRAKLEKHRDEKLQEAREKGDLTPAQLEALEAQFFEPVEKGREEMEDFGFGILGVIGDTLQKNILNPVQKSEQDGQVADENSSKSKHMTKEVTIDRETKELVFNADVKEHKLYKQLLSAAQYQRDAYIMGSQHAELRKSERAADAAVALEIQEQKNTLELKEFDEESDEFVIPYEPLRPQPPTYRDFLRLYPNLDQSTLGFQQLNSLSRWFIPSQTMHNSLLPTVLWTITKPMTPPHNLPHGGPLYRQISKSMVTLVPLGQPLVDLAVKNNVLWVLKDQTMKGWVTGATNGYVSNMQRDAEDDNMGAKFVTTKTVSHQS